MNEARTWSELTTQPTIFTSLRAAWRQRDLAVQVARNDHRAEKQGFVLGRLWFFLSPLLRIGVYAVVFGLLLSGRRPEGFIAFLAVGLFVFGLLQSIITGVGTVFDAKQSLLASLYFPRILLPISVLVRKVLEYRFEALVVLVTIVATTGTLSRGWAVFVAGLAPLALTFALGSGLVVAVIVRAVKDATQVLPVMFRLVFYLSGALFPLASLVEGHPAERFLPLNPFYVYIEIARHLLLETYSEAGVLWVSATLWSSVMIAAGLWLFVRREHLFVRA